MDTIRRLIVMRHAKSDWNSNADSDHARPLNGRGRRDAPRIAERLVEKGWVPQLVLSSDAQRTRETWQRMTSNFDSELAVQFLSGFYHAGLDAVRVQLMQLEASISTVMVIGHNPGWETMVDRLSGEDVRMTTANAALLTVEASDWSEAAVMDGCWQLHEILRPKEL